MSSVQPEAKTASEEAMTVNGPSGVASVTHDAAGRSGASSGEELAVMTPWCHQSVPAGHHRGGEDESSRVHGYAPRPTRPIQREMGRTTLSWCRSGHGVPVYRCTGVPVYQIIDDEARAPQLRQA